MVWPAASNSFSVGRANCGVPQKTSLIARLPFPGTLQLADFAQDKIALEGADAEDEEYSVKVIDFMLEGASQQVVSVPLKPIAFQILGAYFHLGRARDLLPNVRQAETALFLVDLSFLGNDLRIDQGNLVFGGLLKAEIDHRYAFWNPDLRSSEADAMGNVHGLEHIVDQLA